MAYRYTNTEKWSDSWFSNLKPNEKFLFIYLYENCDIAGFIELNIKRWSTDIGLDKKIIEGALKGLRRGLICSNSNDCIYIRTFLKHQKNLPLNPEKNNAHRGIFKRFEVYKHKFEINDIIEFIEGAKEGLRSPYGNGNGNGNGIGKKVENSENQNKSQIEVLYNEVVAFFDESCRPKSEAQKNEWCETLDKLNRIDGFSSDEIISVIESTRKDEFWRSNFLSVLKLRRKNKEGLLYFTVFKNRINGNHRTNINNDRVPERVNKLWDNKSSDYKIPETTF